MGSSSHLGARFIAETASCPLLLLRRLHDSGVNGLSRMREPEKTVQL